MITTLMIFALTAPALAGGNGGTGTGTGSGNGDGQEPVERLYTCWECSLSVFEVKPFGPSEIWGEKVFEAHGMSGEDCEANLNVEFMAEYGSYHPDDWTFWGYHLMVASGVTHVDVIPTADFVQSYMDNTYIGDLERMPESQTCDDSPWYRTLRSGVQPG